jgi:prephenate dehydrogenase
MDEHGTVDVSKDSDNVDRVICHLEDLGLRPILIDADEHDKRMAAQQGVNLLNFEVNRGKLEDSAGIRQIVKSASKILEVFKGQEKSWTPITTESVLKNPFIKHQLVEMAARLAQAQGITTQEIIEEMLAIETTQRKKRRG